MEVAVCAGARPPVYPEATENKKKQEKTNPVWGLLPEERMVQFMRLMHRLASYHRQNPKRHLLHGSTHKPGCCKTGKYRKSRVHSAIVWHSGFALREWTENSMKENLCRGREKGWVKKDVLSCSPPLVFFFLQRVRKCGSAVLWEGVNRRENKQGRTAGRRCRTARREVRLWGEEMQVRWLSCFQWESREPWLSLPRPVLKWRHRHWNLFHGTFYRPLTKHHHHPPETQDLTHVTSDLSFAYFLSWRGMAIPTKQKPSAWEFWENHIFPRTKSSFHLSQLDI